MCKTVNALSLMCLLVADHYNPLLAGKKVERATQIAVVASGNVQLYFSFHQ